MRKIIVSDVHGCLDELRELLRKVEYRDYHDDLIFVGDLVDRGPRTLEIVSYVRKIGGRSVLGNHCEKLVRWRKWERKVHNGEAKHNPMRIKESRLAEFIKYSDEDIDWLEQLPAVISFKAKGKDWLVVHAGFECNDRPPLEQKAKIVMRVRLLGDKNTMVGRPGYTPEGAVYWTERWARSENVVYGHNVHSQASPRIDINSLGATCFGIDTGCCFGGRLTALILDEKSSADYSIVDIPAFDTYAEAIY